MQDVGTSPKNYFNVIHVTADNVPEMFGFVFNVNTRRSLQLPPTVTLSTDLKCCPRNSLGTKVIRSTQRLNH